jgi:hypothetical protein
MLRSRIPWYVFGLLCLVAAPVAWATTGPGYLLRPPKQPLPKSAAEPWLGYYQATSIASDSSITSSAWFCELNATFSPPALVGGIQVYAHDQNGQPSSWTAILYDFTPTAGGGMRIALTGPEGYPTIGHLNLRLAAGNVVRGTLAISSGTYAVSFRRLSRNAPPGRPGQVSAIPVSASSAPAGWGSDLSYLGFYRLLAATGTIPPSAGGGPGIFASIAQFAESGEVPGSAVIPHHGGLSVFTRSTGSGRPSQPVGILWMPGAAPLYLTGLTSAGAQREAQVHAGSFDGPTVGSFSAASLRGGQLLGTVSVASNTVSVELRHS